MGWLLIIEWIKKGYGRGEGRWCGWRRRNTNGDVKNDAGDDAKNDAGDDAGDDTGAEKLFSGQCPHSYPSWGYGLCVPVLYKPWSHKT